jgi:hypothetical protein
LPVLLTSGYSQALVAADSQFDILRKPFEMSALEGAIDRVFEKMRGAAPLKRARAV